MEENRDQVMGLNDRLTKSADKKSRRSKRTIINGDGSVRSSKTYISSLEKKLTEEKRAREKLQEEIEEIKKINSEISSKLGLSTTNKKH